MKLELDVEDILIVAIIIFIICNTYYWSLKL